MPVRANASPCPKCGKPLKAGASKCWFCGEVFDTELCPHCHNPIKKDSTHCWFCAKAIPVKGRLSTSGDPGDEPKPSLDPALSQGIQPSPPSIRLKNEPPTLQVAGIKDCPSCGAQIKLAAVQCKHCGWGKPWYSDSPHASGGILTLAIFSLFCFRELLGPLAVILAIIDLIAMRTGLIGSSGKGLTWAGLIIGICSVMLTVSLYAAVFLNYR